MGRRRHAVQVRRGDAAPEARRLQAAHEADEQRDEPAAPEARHPEAAAQERPPLLRPRGEGEVTRRGLRGRRRQGRQGRPLRRVRPTRVGRSAGGPGPLPDGGRLRVRALGPLRRRGERGGGEGDLESLHREAAQALHQAGPRVEAPEAAALRGALQEERPILEALLHRLLLHPPAADRPHQPPGQALLLARHRR